MTAIVGTVAMEPFINFIAESDHFLSQGNLAPYSFGVETVRRFYYEGIILSSGTLTLLVKPSVLLMTDMTPRPIRSRRRSATFLPVFKERVTLLPR